ncbi:DUF1642 domain-containing protein [Lactococcus petauri]|uniref:DUF1642 domain-containing protein n=1 Tax=Lactococcus petauri TaxID=1940789 RepID=UPI0031329DC0
MKKFEEVKRPAIGIEQSSIKPSLGKVIEFYTDKVKEYHNAFNEMNKYIDGLEAQLDYYKKDKRFEVMAEEILSLKSQLEKRQPEIPEFVANYIEAAKEDFWTLLSAMDDPNLSSRVGDWLKGGNFNNQEIFAQAWINGYTVAKEKRFYLKHKSVLVFDPDMEDSDVEELYLGAGGNFVPYQHLAYKFTQQEIDSMETGSYEQIEVEE